MIPDAGRGTTWWLARGEHDLPSGEEWLTGSEVARAAGMTFAKRRTEYLLRRWVCKAAVASVTGLPGDTASLARIEVGNHSSGAPFVRVDGAPSGLEVSLSDRAGWAVCLVGRAPDRVGCDLELVEPRSVRFVEDFFTTREQEDVAARPPDERDATVNLVWSAKESALKVLGTGLSRDPRSVEVSLDGWVDGPGDGPEVDRGWSRLEVDVTRGSVLPGWWRRAGHFLLAVAAEAPLPAPTALEDSGLDEAGPLHGWLDRPVLD